MGFQVKPQSSKSEPSLNKTFRLKETMINELQDLANKNVYSVGRYGAWTYCSMEDCMVEAKELSEKI